MKSTKSFLALLLMTSLLFMGCAWFSKDEPEKPANQLIQEGVSFYDEGKYTKALKAFEQLKDWYPFSKYAILAELKIADAHYHLKQYPEAIVAYEEFERLHPRNEAVPYVIYQIGLCYYEQIDTIDRDQVAASKALETFRRLERQYPSDPFARKASTHKVKCLKSLTGHELYVGKYYFKQKYYTAALERFKSILTEYPDVGYHREAIRYIAMCEAYQSINSSLK